MEILVVLVVALVVLGPQRLPEAGRQVGRAMNEFRRWSTGMRTEFRDVLDPNTPPAARTPQPATVRVDDVATVRRDASA